MKVTTIFAVDHPTAAGHFPGNPIIPGALLLSEVLHAIATGLTLDLSVCHIKSAKFFHPVSPGIEVTIEFSANPSGVINFQCQAEGQKVMAGMIAS